MEQTTSCTKLNYSTINFSLNIHVYHLGMHLQLAVLLICMSILYASIATENEY